MSDQHVQTTTAGTFEAFCADAEPKLRRALVGGFGAEHGREAAAEALAHGWKHWARVAAMDNPAGYLYTVGARWARRQARRRRRRLLAGAEPTVTWGSRFEPGLEAALGGLSRRQRQAVVLVAGFGMTHAETADLLGLSRSSVQNHVERGMARLRDDLGVDQ
ncbi:MAG: sigma factor-like helix-turn-helix DNA-binding protein [Actinomycetota bacterium]|nr:sigma factor-like helix-turn-helix DNA-binding protein [Actinomycetota bacterium]